MLLEMWSPDFALVQEVFTTDPWGKKKHKTTTTTEIMSKYLETLLYI